MMEFLLRLSRERPDQMARRPPAAQTLAAIGNVTRSIRRLFLQYELKSYEVMRKALAPVTD